MKTKILTTLAVAVILAVMPVFAEEFPQVLPSMGMKPSVYMITSAYDICSDTDGIGSQPNGFNLQLDGCLDLPTEWRFQSYAFTGENLVYKMVARDCNGASDIVGMKMTINDTVVGTCVQTTMAEGANSAQIPLACGGSAQAGFRLAYDKAYDCELTVQSDWHGQYTVDFQATDSTGTTSTEGVSQGWFFNPAVIIDITTNDAQSAVWYQLPAGQSVLMPGQTILSGDKLRIKNMAEGGVDLWSFISSTNFAVAGNCPDSNVFNVDGFANNENYGIKYRCNIGTFEQDAWTPITNKINTAGCSPTSCYNAKPLLAGGVNGMPYSIIGGEKSAECQFSLTLPQQCTGSFSDGKLQIIVKAV